MEATKKLTGKSVKKWLGNNAIIVLMLAVSLIVGIIHPNFFAVANLVNLFKNVSIRYIIALGISGCLIRQRPVRWPSGRFRSLPRLHLCADRGRCW